MSQGLVISSAPQTTSTLLLPLLEPEFRAGHGPAGRLGTWEQEQHGWRGLKSPASCYTWAGLGWAGAALWEQLGRTGLMDSPGGAVKQRLPCWPGAASINGSTCSS